MQGSIAAMENQTGTTPADLAGARLWSYPPAIFDLHLTCNQNCPYCVAGASKDHDFGRIIDQASLARIKTFMHDYGPFNLILTGGEPLITPGLGEILEYLTAEGHLVSMQSNLKSGTRRIFESLSPDRTGWILATLHSVALARSEHFIRSAMDLRAAGYPVVVKLVLDRPMLQALAGLDERMKKEKIPVILAPLIHFPQGREPFPQNYTPEEWSLIAPRMTLNSSWLYFAGGWRSRGHLCRAGSQAFYIRVNSGEVGGCAHNFPDQLGYLYSNTLCPSDRAVSCGLDLCLCDYNYYSGLALDLDDRTGFQQLLAGDQAPVSHDRYLHWLEQAGIKAVNDLTPLLPGALEARISSHGQTGRAQGPESQSHGSSSGRKKTAGPASGPSNRLTVVPVENLSRVLGIEAEISLDPVFKEKSLQTRTLEEDGPILDYLFRNFSPRRHLEFGTGNGRGVELCLKACQASVWTLGESHGGNGRNGFEPGYVQAGLGHRVFQMMADSRKWETTGLPQGFFDSVLINNEPMEDRVIGDTSKALELVRSQGLIVWRYFCPPVMAETGPVRVTMTALLREWTWINEHLASLFWVDRSWLLVGIKK